jgi:hypothetical protein
MTTNNKQLNQELIEYYWHPTRIQKYLEQGLDLE